mgnify:CR=1 FL=1
MTKAHRLDELKTRGRIYGYRYRPHGRLTGKPIDTYTGKITEAKAMQVMIDNNLDFDVALYPYDLVTYGESGQVCQNWMQYLLIKRYLEIIDDDLRKLIADMFETMYDAPGIGLAATQVDVHKRLLVADVSPDKSEPHVLINPEIIERDGVTATDEGCLSVPGFYETVQRAEKIRVRALDRDGQALDMEVDGLLAVCIQHEIDHLDGKLFVDYLSNLKRQRIRKKLEKEARQSGTERPSNRRAI